MTRKAPVTAMSFDPKTGKINGEDIGDGKMKMTRKAGKKKKVRALIPPGPCASCGRKARKNKLWCSPACQKVKLWIEREG
jgi:hypothetical protein